MGTSLIPSVQDAALLLGGLGLFIPFVIAWLPTLKISDYAKFAILVGLSLVGGFLTVVTTGGLNDQGSLIQNSAVILAAAQVFYYTAFRWLGLERVLFPKQALTTEAREQAKDTVPEVSTARAKDILDPNTPSELKVNTTIVNK